MQYVELHARSAFSFLEGASLPETLALTSAGYGLPGMALLDRNGVYGAPRFHLAAKKVGLRAYIGAEVSLGAPHEHAPLLPLLAESREGYQNLCRLISLTKLRADKHDFTGATIEEVQPHAQGLICLTGDDCGPLAQALREGGVEAGRRLLQQLVFSFGPQNVYVELQRHFDPEQEARNEAAVALARELRLSLLATNGVCYAARGDREVMDVFTCIKHKRTLESAGKLLQRNSERHIRNAQEMAALFADLSEAIANTNDLAARLEFQLEDLGYEFPKYPVGENDTEDTFLRKRTFEGACERYRPLHEKAVKQIEHELALIAKLKLSGYFLIVWDIARYCREQGIMVQGRGSAANSAVCYALGITCIDPVGMELLFERFLSEERAEMPDIDLDLPSGDKREQVIQYVYQRYGKHGAAMTANVNTFRSRSAARDVGKVFGFDQETLGKLTSLVGAWEWKSEEDKFENQFESAGLDKSHERIACYLHMCQRIQDLPRHLSQHSGGMVVCQGHLSSVVPLEPATMPGRVVVQWDKDDCADLGLIKIDLLGLGMMAVLEDCTKLIPQHYGEEFDLTHLPNDEEAADVYDAIRRADTIGMFQVESRAQQASLPRNAPRNSYDLVVQVALIRPGPIVGKMTNPYLKRRQGKEPVEYPHPSVEPILKRTLGVPLFQEQLLRLAIVCGGFTGGESEELRRALGSKRSQQRMREIEAKLRRGMSERNIPPTTQETIIGFITSFALYGFPESHAASFARLAYASAVAKVRYLAAFTAALLNNQPMGFYHPASLIKDAQLHGLRVRPVDVTRSQWQCTLEAGKQGPVLRLGLNQISGLQRATAERVLQERERREFASITDLADRVPELSKADLRKLAAAGALNPLDSERKLHRREALWQAERAGKSVGPLLRGIAEPEESSPLKAMDANERLVADFNSTGVTVGPHPMFYRRKEMNRMHVTPANRLYTFKDGEHVRVAGSVITRQRPGTAQGFIFLTLEDETGHANVIVTPAVYKENRMTVLSERFLIIDGILQNTDGVIHIKARRFRRMEGANVPIRSHDFH
jgi:error-prone DNA polymerase